MRGGPCFFRTWTAHGLKNSEYQTFSRITPARPVVSESLPNYLVPNWSVNPLILKRGNAMRRHSWCPHRGPPWLFPAGWGFFVLGSRDMVSLFLLANQRTHFNRKEVTMGNWNNLLILLIIYATKCRHSEGNVIDVFFWSQRNRSKIANKAKVF